MANIEAGNDLQLIIKGLVESIICIYVKVDYPTAFVQSPL